MNKKLGLAVAGAVMALSSAAQAGITIPAGEWTLDISGNVNAYYQNTRASGGVGATGSLATARDANNDKVANGINTGLLPSWLGVSGKTRQNDLDVAFTISFQPNVSDNSAAGDNNTPLNRQAYLTFGDASWGSIKMGKDLGIFAGQAILNDMTLLGVGSNPGSARSGAATTLGGIGTGYIYAAWKGQIAYTTPNWNGFQATLGVTNPNQFSNDATGQTVNQDRLGVEGQLVYSWTGDLSGKAWASFASYDVTTATSDSYTARAYDIGANANMGNFGVTAYYYTGKGAGTTLLGAQGLDDNGSTRDSRGGYLQATYVIPTGTKLGAAYGVSKLDSTSFDKTTTENLVRENRRWTIGAYHPLTKSLNLVAEYNDIRSEAQGYLDAAAAKSKNISLGAILFF